ncbi:MAG: hypothetical protein ABIB79_03950 [archaeon]
MYAWGGDTTSWRGKGGYDFGSARARYDKLGASVKSRSYSFSRSPNMDFVDPKGKTIKSDSEDPLVIAVDVTGSMSSWPGEIFDRLPLLYQTLAKYKPNLEISFAAIGDATCDNWPLQVNDFDKGTNLEAKLKALGCEGGGGGHITESYELFGYFMLNHCKIPNATNPFLLIFGDEAPYKQVDQRQVEHYIGDTLQNPLKSKEMWDKLLQKFNVYFLQKPYGSGVYTGTTNEVKSIWEGSIGGQRIVDLPAEVDTEDGKIPGEQRAVDIAIGLIAKNWGEYEDFKLSLDARHDDPTLKSSVHTSLKHIDDNPPAMSVMVKTGSKLTKSLAD